MRVYPETRLVKHLFITSKPTWYYARTHWDGETIEVSTYYTQQEKRFLLRPTFVEEVPADEVLAHELRHIRQVREGATVDDLLWMEADAYAEIARYRERKSQQPK